MRNQTKEQMTETWSLFTNNDLLVAIIGFVGVTSAIVVMVSAATKTTNRELNLKSQVTDNEEV